ncbi:MAG TPA: S49 family peptidase [Xanthobacteraceae bacterium]|jgi:serine protease SohB
MADQQISDHLKQLLASARETLRPLLPRRFRSDIPVVPVVRLSGIIGFSTPLRPGLTLAAVARQLQRAFTLRHCRAVALLINSPGGSPVQSHLIYLRIRALAEQHNKPVIAFAEDVAASGGYMVACAADEIICDPSSIVGSIGVVGGSFGFVKLIEKVGIERRLYTAGERKAMLDPFLPEKPEDVERLKAVQGHIHEDFIALVKARRGAKLKGPENDLFSGEYWPGRQAVELGLADEIGDLHSVMRRRFGDEVRTPLIAPERSFFGRARPGVGVDAFELFADRADFARDLVSTLEARALWARYGL